MKKMFRKNQVIITALAIMIVVAGYLNFTDEQQVLNTSYEDMKSEGASGNSDDDIISASVNDTIDGDAYAKNSASDGNGDDDGSKAVSADVDTEEDTSEENSENTEDSEKAKEDEDVAAGEKNTEDANTTESEDGKEVAEASVDENGDPIDSNTVGEAVLTSASVTLSQAKLNREQTRSKAKEMLLEIINNETLSEDAKKEAVDKMLSLTERMEKENAAETQLAAKGFADSIVSISDDSVDVTLSIESLTDTQRTQIEDIIMRKTGCDLNQIVITTTK